MRQTELQIKLNKINKKYDNNSKPKRFMMTC